MSSLILDATNIYNLYTEMAFGIAKDAQGQHRITQQELVDIIKQLEVQRGSGTNFFSLTQVTRENTNKIPEFNVFTLSGIKYGKSYVAKVSQVNGIYGHDYAAAVNRQREREGAATDFVAQRSKYDAVEGARALAQKDGQMYLRYKPLSIAKTFNPVMVKNTGNNNFEIVNKQEIEQYIIKPNAGAYQGLQSAEQIRFVSLASVAAININGKDFVVTDLDPMRKAIWQTSGAPMPQTIPEDAQ